MLIDILITAWNVITWVVSAVLTLPLKTINLIKKLFIPKKKPRKL